MNELTIELLSSYLFWNGDFSSDGSRVQSLCEELATSLLNDYTLTPKKGTQPPELLRTWYPAEEDQKLE